MQASYMSVEEAASLLHVSTSRVRQFCRAGRIKANKVGRDWVIDQADARRFAATPRVPHRTKAAPAAKPRKERRIR